MSKILMELFNLRSRNQGEIKLWSPDLFVDPTPKVPCQKPEDEGGHEPKCNCVNCDSILGKFSECEICYEPLQGNGPCMCKECGGMWCLKCDARLDACAWCRTPKTGPTISKGLQRVLEDLMLPCRNYRHGCKELLVGTNRAAHEEICTDEIMSCPVRRKCYSSKFDAISDHLKSNHNLLSVYSRKLKLLIDNVTAKLQMNFHQSHYRVIMLHNKCAFSVKVYIDRFKVSIAISKRKLGLKGAADEDKKPSGYFGMVSIENENEIFAKPIVFQIFNEAYLGRAKIDMKCLAERLKATDSFTINVELDNYINNKPIVQANAVSIN